MRTVIIAVFIVLLSAKVLLQRINSTETTFYDAHTSTVTSIIQLNEPDTIASVDTEGKLKIWNFRTGQLIKTFIVSNGENASIVTLESATKSKNIFLLARENEIVI